MRRVRHGFHPPSQHCEWSVAAVRIALDGLGSKHDGLHSTRANLVDSVAYDRILQASANDRLSTWSLSDSRR